MTDAYLRDPRTDFHQIVADMAGIQRKQAKTVGLGLMYGMGKAKLAHSLDMSVEEAEDMLRKFHSHVGFLRGTIEAVMRRIQRTGSIRTVLGRKCRFPLWEPSAWGIHKALNYEEASAKWGPGGIR